MYATKEHARYKVGMNLVFIGAWGSPAFEIIKHKTGEDGEHYYFMVTSGERGKWHAQSALDKHYTHIE